MSFNREARPADAQWVTESWAKLGISCLIEGSNLYYYLKTLDQILATLLIQGQGFLAFNLLTLSHPSSKPMTRR